MAFATPTELKAQLMLPLSYEREVAHAGASVWANTELKAQLIMPMSYERGRIRLQAQQKEASPPYRLVADLPFLSLCAASSPRPEFGP